MKLMSFNTQHCLNYVERRIDFDIMAEAIRRCDPDVVGLNEIRGLGAAEDYQAQTEILAALTGMKYFYFAKAIDFAKGPYGNAILSKIPIKLAETIMIPDPCPRAYGGYYETRCILKAELEGDVRILVTHIGLNPDEQENAVRAALVHIREKRCVLMGDFNMLPSDTILKPLFEKMSDTAEKFEGERLSFPSDAPNRKIDYILTSPDAHIISADIPSIIASDHRPHIASVEF